MRIGIVTTWFERGAAYVSRQYADSLRKAGHDVFVFARGGETYAKNDPNWDFEWVHWGKKTLLCDLLGVDLRDLKKWLNRQKIELVIFNEQQSWGPVLLCQKLGIKTVAYLDYYTEQTVPYFAVYDALICNTKRHYSAFDWHSGAVYLPWGTDTNLFRPKDEKPGLVSEGEVTFFHSAGMSPERKGTDLLIQAFSQIRGSSRLIIHTQVELAKCFPDLLGVIEPLECEGRLECITKTVPAPGLYHMGDVYVYPARLDGIGLTVCEAMACGLPAIVPDNAPMCEFVPTKDVGARVKIDRFVSRFDGYYWPQCWTNVDDLAEKMQFYVDHPEIVASSKEAAMNYTRKERDWHINTNHLGAIIKGVERVGKEMSIKVEGVWARMIRNFNLNLRMGVKHMLKRIGLLR